MNSERNRAFVLAEYFGCLRRDPDASGFNFWLAKLNENGGDFRKAEMVKASWPRLSTGSDLACNELRSD